MLSQDIREGEDPAALQQSLRASQAWTPGRPFPVQTGVQGRDQEFRQNLVLRGRAQRWGLPLVSGPAGAPGRAFLVNLADALGSGLEKSIDPK